MEDLRDRFVIDDMVDIGDVDDSPKTGDEPFVKGPIPLSWVTKAGALGGKCLHTGMILWHHHGLNRGKPFQISHRRLSEHGVGTELTAKRSLDSLAASGLISVRFKSGQRKEIAINVGGYPDYRKILPNVEPQSTYSAVGKSPRFAMWVGAALGCYVDPKLVPLDADEFGEVFVQKKDGYIMPLTFRNDHTLVVVMPMKLDGNAAEQLDRMQLDRLMRHRKMKVVKAQPKKESVPWWTALVRRKAA